MALAILFVFFASHSFQSRTGTDVINLSNMLRVLYLFSCEIFRLALCCALSVCMYCKCRYYLQGCVITGVRTREK